MGLPDSHYTTTRLHPKLDSQHKLRRYVWSISFWIFWNSAKAMAQKVQVLLLHMDEKWFFEIIIRKHNKCIPFYGCFPVNHTIHHKSHIGKTMVTCSSAFEPFGNDMEQGGLAHKRAFDRVGWYLAATKDAYRHVYRTDGTYHYPKQDDNLIRRKGDLMWQNLKITGSKQGTEKSPKWLLLKWWEEKELPRLDEQA